MAQDAVTSKIPFGDVFERFGTKHFDRRAPFVPCGVHKTGVVHHVIRVVMGEKEVGDVFGQTAGTDEVVDDAPPTIKEDAILANLEQIPSRSASGVGFGRS